MLLRRAPNHECSSLLRPSLRTAHPDLVEDLLLLLLNSNGTETPPKDTQEPSRAGQEPATVAAAVGCSGTCRRDHRGRAARGARGLVLDVVDPLGHDKVEQVGLEGPDIDLLLEGRKVVGLYRLAW